MLLKIIIKAIINLRLTFLLGVVHVERYAKNLSIAELIIPLHIVKFTDHYCLQFRWGVLKSDYTNCDVTFSLTSVIYVIRFHMWWSTLGYSNSKIVIIFWTTFWVRLITIYCNFNFVTSFHSVLTLNTFSMFNYLLFVVCVLCSGIYWITHADLSS